MTKPAKTYQEQLTLLESRGLLINDRQYALHCLQHLNYYRLSAYRFPFTLRGNPDQFLPGTTFDQILSLYRFDAVLRNLLFEGCKRVEISVRARWAYEIGHHCGPLGYLNNQNFNDPLVHARALNTLSAEMARSTEEFVRHHHKCLKQPWPPIWVLCELASFGAISKLLASTHPPRLRQNVADTYGLDEKTLCSLVHHFTVLRNVAAHHARIWNRKLTFTVKLPTHKPLGLYQNFTVDSAEQGTARKLYNSLVMLIYMMNQLHPHTDWPVRLLSHINTLDPALVPAMGFPADWQARPLWAAITPNHPTAP